MGLGFQDDSFIVGKFVDTQRPMWREEHDDRMRKRLGDAFVPYAGPDKE